MKIKNMIKGFKRKKNVEEVKEEVKQNEVEQINSEVSSKTISSKYDNLFSDIDISYNEKIKETLKKNKQESLEAGEQPNMLPPAKEKEEVVAEDEVSSKDESATEDEGQSM